MVRHTLVGPAAMHRARSIFLFTLFSAAFLSVAVEGIIAGLWRPSAVSIIPLTLPPFPILYYLSSKPPVRQTLWRWQISGALLAILVSMLSVGAIARLSKFPPDAFEELFRFPLVLTFGTIVGYPILVLMVGFLFPQPSGLVEHVYCNDCGYDLTGNRTGRCPECGASIRVEDMQEMRRLERWEREDRRDSDG